MKQIQDYQQTQALQHLAAEHIALSRVAAQAVIANAQAHIEPQILQHAQLPQSLAQQLPTLAQLFIALDSTYSRHAVQSATVYGLLPQAAQLVRLAHLGAPTENLLPLDDEHTWHYLAVRTAQSGWANIAEDIAKWLQIDELRGEHNQRAHSQTSLPICGEDGVVYGVLHLEHNAPLPDDELAAWVGLTLGILPTMRELLPQPETDKSE